jgi:hypothetical protein
MTVLLAVLLSGVLLDSKDLPVSEYHLVFIDANAQLIEVAVTGTDGKFKVDLAPGAYRVQVADKTWEPITVDKSTSKLDLHRRAPAPGPMREHVIEVIQGTQRDIMRVPLDLTAPVPPRHEIEIKGDPLALGPRGQ